MLSWGGWGWGGGGGGGRGRLCSGRAVVWSGLERPDVRTVFRPGYGS